MIAALLAVVVWLVLSLLSAVFVGKCIRVGRGGWQR